jgi:large conductance mechanosensitive channel
VIPGIESFPENTLFVWGEAMWNEFKKFAMRGNVIDLAVGVIIGGAFGKLISSLVNDLLMPLLGLLIGRVDFTNMFFALDGKHYASAELAQEAGVATINFGVFLNNVVDFLIVAFVIFLVVRQINRMKRPGLKLAPTTKTCIYCQSNIPLKATRCPHCTSELPE